MRILYRWLAVAAAVGASLGGCSDRAVETAAPDAPIATAASLPARSVDSLRALAVRAVREQRIYTPVRDNAIEHYLAARARAPEDPAIAAALIELHPYTVIATEQALARNDVAEARRLLDLAGRSNPQAPALPRLRASLEAALASIAQRERDAAESEAAESEALAAAQQAQAAQQQARATAVAAVPTPGTTTATVPVDTPQAPLAATAPAIPAPLPVPAAVTTAPPPRTATSAPQRDVASTAVSSAAPGVTSNRGSLPRLLSEVPPRYPLLAMNRKMEGKVEVAFTIQPDGSVSNPHVVAADPPGIFDKSALTAVSRYRFEASGRSHATTRKLNFSLSDD